MPTSHQPPTASEPANPPNENAAVQRAYGLISQLRGHGPESSSLPRTTLGSSDWREATRGAHAIRVAGFSGSPKS